MICCEFVKPINGSRKISLFWRWVGWAWRHCFIFSCATIYLWNELMQSHFHPQTLTLSLGTGFRSDYHNLISYFVFLSMSLHCHALYVVLSLSFYQDSSPRNLPGVSSSLSRRGACPSQGPEDAVVLQISPLPCTRKVVAFLKAVFYTQVLHRSYFLLFWREKNLW